MKRLLPAFCYLLGLPALFAAALPENQEWTAAEHQPLRLGDKTSGLPSGRSLLPGQPARAAASSGHYAFRVGVHVNPVLNLIKSSNKSDFNESSFTYKKSAVGVSLGGNVRFELNRLILESGASYVRKSYEFTQSAFGIQGTSGSQKLSTSLYSVEIPVILGINVLSGKSTSVLMPLVGISFNKSKLISSEYSNLVTATPPATVGVSRTFEGLVAAGQKKKYPDQAFIAGFKVLNGLKKIGAIEYGLTYHLALSEHPAMTLKSSATMPGQPGVVQTVGTFAPNLNYLNLHLTYYPLNLEKQSRTWRTIKYK